MTQQTSFGDDSWGFGIPEETTEEQTDAEDATVEASGDANENGSSDATSEVVVTEPATEDITSDGGAAALQRRPEVKQSQEMGASYLNREPRPADWPGMPLKCIKCDFEYRTTVPRCPGCGHRWESMLDYRQGEKRP